MVLRGQLENTSPSLDTAIQAYRKLKLTPVTAPPVALLPTKPLPQLRLTSTQLNEVTAAFTAGATVRELAEHYGMNRKTIARHLKARGCQLVHSMNDAEKAKAIELYTQGWSLARVGSALGFDAGTVHAAIRRAGVRTRDCHGRER